MIRSTVPFEQNNDTPPISPGAGPFVTQPQTSTVRLTKTRQIPQGARDIAVTTAQLLLDHLHLLMTPDRIALLLPARPDRRVDVRRW